MYPQNNDLRKITNKLNKRGLSKDFTNELKTNNTLSFLDIL